MIGWLLFGVVLGSLLGPVVLFAWAVGEAEVERWRAARRPVPPHRVLARIGACPSPPPRDGRPTEGGPASPAPVGRFPLDYHPWL